MPIPWTSWAAMAAFIVIAAVIVVRTHAPVVPGWIRWTVTILWFVVTVGLGIYDFVLGAGAEGAPIDIRPIDRWTVSHTAAGLVFGVWFVPLIWTTLIVVAWEFFEVFVPGFGENEILANHAIDVGVAIVGWFVVVLIAKAVTGAAIPIISNRRRAVDHGPG
jgi:hypothetical protein